MTVCLYSLSNPTAWFDSFRSLETDAVQINFQKVFGFPFARSAEPRAFSSFFLVPIALAVAACWLVPILKVGIPPISTYTVLQGELSSLLVVFPIFTILFSWVPGLIINKLVHRLFKYLIDNTWYFSQKSQPANGVCPITPPQKALLHCFSPNFLRNFLRALSAEKTYSTEIPSLLQVNGLFFSEVVEQIRQWTWYTITNALILWQCLRKYGCSFVSLQYLSLGLFFSFMNLYVHPLLWQNMIDLESSITKDKKGLKCLIIHIGYHLTSGFAQGAALWLSQTAPLVTLPPPLHFIAQLWLFSTAWMHCISSALTPRLYLYTRDLTHLLPKPQFDGCAGNSLAARNYIRKSLPHSGEKLLYSNSF